MARIGAVPDAPLVIVNPTAGAGRAARLVPWLRERLARRPEARLEVTRRRGDAEGWAAEAAEAHDRVVAVGGDGTVQEVVNGLRAGRGAASLGVVPVGSGNDLARSLRLPPEPAQAWTVAVGNSVAPLDVALAHGHDGRARWFVSAGGAGFDAKVATAMASRRGWQRGRAGYLATALTELWRYRNRPVRIAVDGGEPIERRVLLVAFTNGAYYGGGMRIAPDARADDGLMDVCIVGDIGRLAALGQIPNLYRGRHVGHPTVEMSLARQLELDGDDHTMVHLDGEPFGTLPVRVELRAAALSVAMPLR